MSAPPAELVALLDGAAFAECSGVGSHTVSGLASGGHTFEVRATDPAGNAATASRAFSVAGEDNTRPNTALRKPKVKGKTVTLKFSSTEADSTFTCKLDRKPARECSSPQRYRKLKKGRHTVTVTATDAAGNADRTPAKARFKVKRK